ncbi:MAG: IS66 family transposase, partial [Rickettsiales bacterium]
SNERSLTKAQPKRQKLPDHLERIEIVHDVAPICTSCGGENLRKISDDVSETLEYIRAKIKVIKHVRPRCICSNCDNVMQAYPASGPIEKGLAGPGLLAHVITQKYCYHLPLYRQAQMFERDGIHISRSTMGGWMFECGVILMPLIQSLIDYVFSATHLHGDDTPVKVLAPGLKKTKTGRIWTYVVDGRGHGSHLAPAVYYCYSPDRKGERPVEHLTGFKGVLHADAYSGYNAVYELGVTEAGCWAHTRRKFYEIVIVSDHAEIAYNALRSIQELYKIEEEIRGKNPEIRLEYRQAQSKEIVEKMFKEFEDKIKNLPKKGSTALAINYALNNKAALMRFLDDGKIEIDNNIAERALRGVAVGRKNWLFAGSDRGGHTAAAFFSLIESAKLNGLDPEKYLRHVLTVIQDYNAKKIYELLPWNIKLH